MIFINKKVRESLKKEQINTPIFKREREFTDYIFEVIDPITNDCIKTYNLTYEEFHNLNYKEQKKYKSLKKTEIKKEEEFNSYMKKYEKEKEIYDKKVEELYKQHLLEEKISYSEAENVKMIMETVLDVFDFDSFDEQTKENFEMNILKDVQKIRENSII